MSRLRSSGYQAYLVGGAVRDLLLGGHPKDFDIATDATPEEVRALFNNSRLIGRRFRLAHVRFGREIIEVATSPKYRNVSIRQLVPLLADAGRGVLMRLMAAGVVPPMVLLPMLLR